MSSTGETNIKWEIVKGSERMSKYGVFNFTIPIAEQFSKTPGEVEKMSFGEVFAIKSYNGALSKIQKEMSEIKIKA